MQVKVPVLFTVPFTLLILIACLLPLASAHEVITTQLSWTRNIRSIVHDKCVSCHRPGGSAPMSLMSYEDARPWAKAIKFEVLRRSMPPWGAVKGFGTFENDISLSLTEVALISSWVEGGAPEGSRLFDEVHKDHKHDDSNPGSVAADTLLVTARTRLQQDLLVVGVSPGLVPNGEWRQLTAHLPDGQVKHLIWLRGNQPKSPMDYWLLQPLKLPAGTMLLCEPPDASVGLRIKKTRD